MQDEIIHLAVATELKSMTLFPCLSHTEKARTWHDIVRLHKKDGTRFVMTDFLSDIYGQCNALLT